MPRAGPCARSGLGNTRHETARSKTRICQISEGVTGRHGLNCREKVRLGEHVNVKLDGHGRRKVDNQLAGAEPESRDMPMYVPLCRVEGLEEEARY